MHSSRTLRVRMWVRFIVRLLVYIPVSSHAMPIEYRNVILIALMGQLAWASLWVQRKNIYIFLNEWHIVCKKVIFLLFNVNDVHKTLNPIVSFALMSHKQVHQNRRLSCLSCNLYLIQEKQEITVLFSTKEVSHAKANLLFCTSTIGYKCAKDLIKLFLLYRMNILYKTAYAFPCAFLRRMLILHKK